jgi:hypothetical protein
VIAERGRLGWPDQGSEDDRLYDAVFERGEGVTALRQGVDGPSSFTALVKRSPGLAPLVRGGSGCYLLVSTVFGLIVAVVDTGLSG